MLLRRGLFAAALCGLVLGISGCGGDGGEDAATQLTGAEMVPANVPLYMSINTDLDSEQWQAALDLLDKFPGKDEFLAELKTELASDEVDFERDVRPVLGPEIGVAWLDVEDEDSFLGLMQPKDSAKLNALLEKGDDPSVHREIEGWTVFADSEAILNLFEQQRARSGDKLSGSDAYKEAVGELPEDALFKLYFGGPQVQQAIDDAFAEEGAPEGLAREVADFRSAALALTAEAEGVRLEAGVIAGSDSDLDTYEPELPSTLPAGALFYLSYARLDEPTREVLEAVEDLVPNFDQQLTEVEQAFGFSVENDLLPLLENEGAVAVYADEPIPAVLFALRGDEEKALRLMDRLGALIELGDEGSTKQETVGGLTVKEIAFPDEGFSIFYAALEGVFVASNSREQVLAANGDGPKLADDAVYTNAREGTGAEGGTIGLLYGNLKDGLPFLYDYYEEAGDPIPLDVQENTKPLQSFLLSLTQEGNRYELSGFQAIK